MPALTPNQAEVAAILNPHLGATVLILTSGYTANVAPAAIKEAVGTIKSATLRGLEARGFLKVEGMWKGARVTVLKIIA